ncbi:MAG: hypothetical protein MJA29_13285 [Candidatus Omnitrophica bacterium]|nr:hypothetical protein [Candidatus Omnitrophota bacterium]
MGVKTSIKTGSEVEWTSQASGYKKTKRGRVVAVLKKDVDYTAGQNIPQRIFVDILRKYGKYSREDARAIVEAASFYDLEEILWQKYKVRFKILEGMQREETHYLIEVDQGENRKPYLYHPRAGETFTVIK